jgi:hypothetical protein
MLIEKAARHQRGSTSADWSSATRTTSDAIEQRLRMGDYAGVVREVEAAAQAMFAAETKNALVQAGRAQAAWMDTKVPDKLVRFDHGRPAVRSRGPAQRARSW